MQLAKSDHPRATQDRVSHRYARTLLEAAPFGNTIRDHRFKGLPDRTTAPCDSVIQSQLALSVRSRIFGGSLGGIIGRLGSDTVCGYPERLE
jgi:hypothetical protein